MEIEILENFETAKYTTFKVGGVVKRAIFPKTVDEFIYALKIYENPIILGNCSNVIISSFSVNRNVIFTTKMKNFEITGNKVTVDAGVKGPLISQKVADYGLSGFEFMIGFPGTIGGNIFMNASAHKQSISEYLISAIIYDTETNVVKEFTKADLEFDYRSSICQRKRLVVLSATFELEKSTVDTVKQRMAENLEFRKQHQPNLALPNCGSVFKNPVDNSAGKLLDEVGGKSFSVGGACVWENHANFIINKNNATSLDILNLMLMMYNRVKENFKIELNPEVRYIGDSSEDEGEICKILYKK